MNKSEVISFLQRMRFSHERWLESGEKLLAGTDLKKIKKPLEHDEYLKGKSFQIEMSHIGSITGLKSIEAQFQKFHSIYEALYVNAPRVHKSKGIFSSRKLQAEQLRLLTEDFARLEKISKELTKKLLNVEQIVTSMSDRIFERNKQLSNPVSS